MICRICHCETFNYFNICKPCCDHEMTQILRRQLPIDIDGTPAWMQTAEHCRQSYETSNPDLHNQQEPRS